MANKTEMQSSELAGAKPAVSTQSHLDIEEIKEGTIVLKNGGLRAVIIVSSTNFSLKSGEEQNALIGAYQSFLNSLEYPIQLLMQSRKLDINIYLDKLRGIMQEQTNELLRLQTQEYIEYVSKLVEYASIMDKTFYVVVPYSANAIKEGFFAKLGSMFNPAGTIMVKRKDFDEHRDQLYQRVSQISSALGGMGLKTMTLNTEELIELVYNSYNLGTASPIHIKSVEELDLAQSENN